MLKILKYFSAILFGFFAGFSVIAFWKPEIQVLFNPLYLTQERICREDYNFCVDYVQVIQGAFDTITTSYVFFLASPPATSEQGSGTIGDPFIKFNQDARVEVEFDSTGNLIIYSTGGYVTVGQIPKGVTVVKQS